MARIVGIHGIAQQVRGPEVLRATWAPALRDGVALSGAEPPDEADLEIAFYGDLFRPRGGKAVAGPQYVAADVEEGFERELLEAWWAEAAASEDAVPGPDATTKVRTPRTAQRALNALSQSRFFAGLTERLIIGFIKQVHTYLSDDDVRAEIQARVERVVGPGTAGAGWSFAGFGCCLRGGLCASWLGSGSGHLGVPAWHPQPCLRPSPAAPGGRPGAFPRRRGDVDEHRRHR